jgi:hypothetical protein
LAQFLRASLTIAESSARPPSIHFDLAGKERNLDPYRVFGVSFRITESCYGIAAKLFEQ